MRHSSDSHADVCLCEPWPNVFYFWSSAPDGWTPFSCFPRPLCFSHLTIKYKLITQQCIKNGKSIINFRHALISSCSSILFQAFLFRCAGDNRISSIFLTYYVLNSKSSPNPAWFCYSTLFSPYILTRNTIPAHVRPPS